MSANCTTIRASYGRATGRTVEEVARLAVVVTDTGHRHSRGWVGISAHRDGKAMQGDRARGLGIAFSVDFAFCTYIVYGLQNDDS